VKKLHPKQASILTLLKENIDNPLTLTELSRQADINSPGVLYHHLHQLENKGYLKRHPNNPKDYIIVESPEKSVVYINKFGQAQCGPEGLMLDGAPIERVPIPSKLLRFSSSEAFIVEAKGDSMEPKIKPGSIVVAKRQNHAQSGDIVVCVLDEKVLIKQYLIIGKRVVLHSLNEQFKLIEVRENNNLIIEGIVKNIIHYDHL
jgi:repressor LexA